MQTEKEAMIRRLAHGYEGSKCDKIAAFSALRVNPQWCVSDAANVWVTMDVVQHRCVLHLKRRLGFLNTHTPHLRWRRWLLIAVISHVRTGCEDSEPRCLLESDKDNTFSYVSVNPTKCFSVSFSLWPLSNHLQTGISEGTSRQTDRNTHSSPQWTTMNCTLQIFWLISRSWKANGQSLSWWTGCFPLVSPCACVYGAGASADRYNMTTLVKMGNKIQSSFSVKHS